MEHLGYEFQDVIYDFLGRLLSQRLYFEFVRLGGVHMFNFVFHQPGFLPDSAFSSEPHLVVGIFVNHPFFAKCLYLEDHPI